MIRPEMLEALKFHAKLREEGLIDPESLTTSGGDWLNKIYSSKVGLFCHNGGSGNAFTIELQKNLPDAEFIMIPSPIGPYGDKGTYKYSSVFQSTYINKDFKDVRRFFKFLDDMCQDDAQLLVNFGIEEEDYTIVNGQVQYEMPTVQMLREERNWRGGIGFIKDETFNKWTVPFEPKQDALMYWFEQLAPNEGISHIDPGPLKSIQDNPELKPGASVLFWDASAKIFFGQGDPDQVFDEFVNGYLRRGGDKIIQEANEIYNAGKAFMRD